MKSYRINSFGNLHNRPCDGIKGKLYSSTSFQQVLKCILIECSPGEGAVLTVLGEKRPLFHPLEGSEQQRTSLSEKQISMGLKGTHTPIRPIASPKTGLRYP